MTPEQNPYEMGSAAFLNGRSEWDNPFHPSLQREENLEWNQGFVEAHDPGSSLIDFLYEGDEI